MMARAGENASEALRLANWVGISSRPSGDPEKIEALGQALVYAVLALNETIENASSCAPESRSRPSSTSDGSPVVPGTSDEREAPTASGEGT
jgi:hypothetical protein